MISAVLQKNQSQTWKCYQQHKYMNRSDEDINVQFASLNLTTSLSVSSDLYRIKEKSHFLVDVIILFCFFVPACAKVCVLVVSLRYLHPGEVTSWGQRLPPPSPQLRCRSRPAEQTQRDAALHPLYCRHEAAARQVDTANSSWSCVGHQLLNYVVIKLFCGPTCWQFHQFLIIFSLKSVNKLSHYIQSVARYI